MQIQEQSSPKHVKAKRSQKSAVQETATTAQPATVPKPETASLNDFGMLAAIMGIGGLVVLLKVRNDRKAEQRNKEQAFTRIQYQAENPLDGCVICTACGWFGRATPRVIHTARSGGCAGASGVIIGALLVLIGIPMLLLGGIGVLPIALGTIILVSSSNTASITSSQRNAAISIAATTPNNCPQCKNHSVIPANSPNARNMIATTPHLLAATTEEIHRARALAQSQIVQDAPQILSENRQ